MNQRIKKLAEQASTFASRETTDLDEWEFIFRKKFAELIVRECANIANDNDYDGSSVGNRMFFEHFGVEE